MSHPSPIFAFWFVNLAMLGWLAAAAVPILIHLWSRQKYREMSWAAMEYLLAAIKRQTRRLRFEQLLLLVLRTLLVILLVLAVAEPYWKLGGFVFVPGQRTHRVLVIDGSYSMAYKPAEKSHFDRAKQLAKQIVEDSPQGDGFTLVLMSEPPQVVVGTPAFEPRSLLEEIDNLELPHTSADLPATLARVEGILTGARREQPKLTREAVYFLTDLNRVGWVPRLSGAAMADFRERSEKLAQSATLVVMVIDPGQPAAENVAVTDLRLLEPVATLDQSIHLEAKLENFGRQRRTRQPVKLLVDGRLEDQRYVDLAPGGEDSVAFSCRFDAPGDHTIEVRTEGDSLDVDNHRWMAIPLRRAVRVLCINGRPSGEPFRGATDYLVYALLPRDDRAGQPPVQAEVAPESALLERDLGQYDCVFLCNVAQFTSSEARVLNAYLTGGGNLVFFLGDQVLADRYNRELGGGGGGPRILPARLGPIVAVPQQRPLNPLEYRHPIVRAFDGRQGAGLLSTPISKYFKLSVSKESKANVVLATAGGDPLIVEEPIRRGRVLLVATSASDVLWTSMPMWPSYVPLVHEMLAFCLGGNLQQRQLTVGQPLGASVPTPAADVTLTVRTPEGRSRQVRLRPEGDYSEWSFAETLTSGVYTAQFGPPLLRSDRFAVNVDTAESDLAKLTPEQLREEVWPGVPFETSREDLDQQPVARIGRRGTFSKGLLYLVLGMLFLETLLAWLFGHHAR